MFRFVLRGEGLVMLVWTKLLLSSLDHAPTDLFTLDFFFYRYVLIILLRTFTTTFFKQTPIHDRTKYSAEPLPHRPHPPPSSTDLWKSQDKLVPRPLHNTRQLTTDMHGVYFWCF